MSSFICDKCGKEIIDTEDGYITECEHYPFEKKTDTEHLSNISLKFLGKQIDLPEGFLILVDDNFWDLS